MYAKSLAQFIKYERDTMIFWGSQSFKLSRILTKHTQKLNAKINKQAKIILSYDIYRQ